MIIADLPPLRSNWRDAIRHAGRRLSAGERLDPAVVFNELPPAVAGRPEVLVGALSIGGMSLARAVALRADPGRSLDEAAAAVVDALCDLGDRRALLAEAADGSAAETSAVEAPGQWLDSHFGPFDAPERLLERLRLEILIDQGPVDGLPDVVREALELEAPAVALKALERLRAELGSAAPKPLFGLAVTALHQLGRYDEAARWLAEGLGDQASLVAPLPPIDEADLIAGWQGETDPVVSIICTTYNHERFIEDALRGFVGQRCPWPFEILIHDDASTDSTQRLIRQWAERYPRLIRPVLQTENQLSRGIRPWETLLASARGRYVALCEGDDYWIDAGKLALQVGYLEAHPDVVCSSHNLYHLRELTVSVSAGHPNRQEQVVPAERLRAVQKMLWMPTVVFRRAFRRLPPERDLAAFGDQFLISVLGTHGSAACLDGYFGAVRRENEFSTWSPLPEAEKERRRVRTWAAIVRFQRRLGHDEAANYLDSCIGRSPLDGAEKAAILASVAAPELPCEAG